MDDKFFENFYNYKGFGPAIQVQDVPDSSFLKYRNRLPAKLLEYWKDYGWGGYAEGLFWVTNPEEYQPAVDAWLRDTPFEDSDNYYVIARGAFGKLFVWGETSGPSIEILAPYSQIYPTDCSDDIARRGMDREIQSFFSTMNKETPDLTDDDEKPLFQRALAKLGPLAADEMYGFVPALALGGANRVEKLQRVKAVEHLVLLADLGERTIMADIVAIAKSNGLM